MPRLARWAAAPALALLAVSLIVALSGSEWRYAGTNAVRSLSGVVTVAPGRSVCQPGQVVPRGAAFAEFVVDPLGAPGSSLHLRVQDAAGRRIAEGSRRGPGAAGLVAVPMPERRATTLEARVCLENAGRRPLRLGGMPIGGPGVRNGGRLEPALVRIGWREAKPSTGWSALPAIAHRFAIVKPSWVGAWTFWVLVALMAAAGALAVRLALPDREERA
jgi:hypothetical protein